VKEKNEKNMLFVLFLILATACIPSMITQSQEETLSTPLNSSAEGTSLFIPVVLSNQNIDIPTPEPTSIPTPEPTTSPSSALVADHRIIDHFELIPGDALPAAIETNYLQLHASTGMYISHGLDFLQGTRDIPNNPYTTYVYDRRNWVWLFWEGITDPRPKVNQFVSKVQSEYQSYDVLSMKFCYQDYWGLDWEYFRDNMVQLEVTYPDKTFIWWTVPLKNDWSRYPNWCSIVEEFNTTLRSYTAENNKILFDIADIESHDELGNRCYPGCETMCPQYGDGHPNAEGSLRLAKGIWWLMTRITGWDGDITAE
jgi:hypothetical protein